MGLGVGVRATTPQGTVDEVVETDLNSEADVTVINITVGNITVRNATVRDITFKNITVRNVTVRNVECNGFWISIG